MGEYEIVPTGGRARSAEKNRAVFLDRDGVISRSMVRNSLPFAPTNLSDFEILPEVPEACRRLKQAGFVLVVVTNQPEVGRGTMKQEVVEQMHAKMSRELPIDRVEVCYHPGHGMSDCDCRKPKPGLLLKAANEMKIDLTRSWMVGDRWRDVDCARAAGCRSIFIERDYEESLRTSPDFTVRSFNDAVNPLLRDAGC